MDNRKAYVLMPYIEINYNARKANCTWYCTEVGKIFYTRSRKKYGCYVVVIKNEVHLVHPNHCKEI